MLLWYVSATKLLYSLFLTESWFLRYLDVGWDLMSLEWKSVYITESAKLGRGNPSVLHPLYETMCSISLFVSATQTLLTWCCGEDRKQVKDISVLSHILLDWRIWHKALPTVWEKLLRQLDDLLASGDDVNIMAFAEAMAIIKILYTTKV